MGKYVTWPHSESPAWVMYGDHPLPLEGTYHPVNNRLVFHLFSDPVLKGLCEQAGVQPPQAVVITRAGGELACRNIRELMLILRVMCEDSLTPSLRLDFGDITAECEYLFGPRDELVLEIPHTLRQQALALLHTKRPSV